MPQPPEQDHEPASVGRAAERRIESRARARVDERPAPVERDAQHDDLVGVAAQRGDVVGRTVAREQDELRHVGKWPRERDRLDRATRGLYAPETRIPGDE